VALIGRSRRGETASHIEPSVAASILWTRCGSFDGRCEYETVEPYRLDSGPGPEAREVVTTELRRLRKIPSIKTAVQDLDSLDVVIGGFGSLTANPKLKGRVTMGSVLRSVVSSDQLAREGVVGDYCYCPFDKNGECPEDEDWEFFLTAGHYSSRYKGINFYRHMVEMKKKVVGIGGPDSLPVIRAALKGKVVNVLILDEYSAQQLAKDPA
jgi:DNA-binding transcriptional regulator LsrR (DeoR family)